MSKQASFWNWVGGIVAAIIAGFILWWLTGENSPFKGKEPPEVKITRFNTQKELFKSEESKATIKVYNNGKVIARNCKVFWYGQGTAKEPTETELFSLIPSNPNELPQVISYKFSDTGIFKSLIVLKCEDCKPDSFVKEITVKSRRLPDPVTLAIVGGPGGNDFADNPPFNIRIKRITIYGSALSTGIRTTWEMRMGAINPERSSAIHGGTRTDSQTLRLRDGEYVTSVSGYYRKFQNTTSPIITKLKIETNAAQMIQFGIQEEGAIPFHFIIPADSMLVGFKGRAGTLINAIGVVVRRR